MQIKGISVLMITFPHEALIAQSIYLRTDILDKLSVYQ